jgi:hypothetical protein
LAVMSLAQGLCNSLMEFAWKCHMRLLYPSPADFTAFLGRVGWILNEPRVVCSHLTQRGCWDEGACVCCRQAVHGCCQAAFAEPQALVLLQPSRLHCVPR